MPQTNLKNDLEGIRSRFDEDRMSQFKHFNERVEEIHQVLKGALENPDTDLVRKMQALDYAREQLDDVTRQHREAINSQLRQFRIDRLKKHGEHGVAPNDFDEQKAQLSEVILVAADFKYFEYQMNAIAQLQQRIAQAEDDQIESEIAAFNESYSSQLKAADARILQQRDEDLEAIAVAEDSEDLEDILFPEDYEELDSASINASDEMIEEFEDAPSVVPVSELNRLMFNEDEDVQAALQEAHANAQAGQANPQGTQGDAQADQRSSKERQRNQRKAEEDAAIAEAQRALTAPNNQTLMAAMKQGSGQWSEMSKKIANFMPDSVNQSWKAGSNVSAGDLVKLSLLIGPVGAIMVGIIAKLPQILEKALPLAIAAGYALKFLHDEHQKTKTFNAGLARARQRKHDSLEADLKEASPAELAAMIEELNYDDLLKLASERLQETSPLTVNKDDENFAELAAIALSDEDGEKNLNIVALDKAGNIITEKTDIAKVDRVIVADNAALKYLDEKGLLTDDQMQRCRTHATATLSNDPDGNQEFATAIRLMQEDPAFNAVYLDENGNVTDDKEKVATVLIQDDASKKLLMDNLPKLSGQPDAEARVNHAQLPEVREHALKALQHNSVAQIKFEGDASSQAKMLEAAQANKQGLLLLDEKGALLNPDDPEAKDKCRGILVMDDTAGKQLQIALGVDEDKAVNLSISHNQSSPQALAEVNEQLKARGAAPGLQAHINDMQHSKVGAIAGKALVTFDVDASHSGCGAVLEAARENDQILLFDKDGKLLDAENPAHAGRVQRVVVGNDEAAKLIQSKLRIENPISLNPRNATGDKSDDILGNAGKLAGHLPGLANHVASLAEKAHADQKVSEAKSNHGCVIDCSQRAPKPAFVNKLYDMERKDLFFFDKDGQQLSQKEFKADPSRLAQIVGTSADANVAVMEAAQGKLQAQQGQQFVPRSP